LIKENTNSPILDKVTPYNIGLTGWGIPTKADIDFGKVLNIQATCRKKQFRV